jgi:hypothetical protein
MQRLVPLGLLLLLGACASSAVTLPAGQSERSVTLVDAGSGTRTIDMVTEANIASMSIDAPPAAAWTALLRVYSDLGLEVSGADSRTHMVQMTNKRLRRIENRRMSAYLDCGSGNSGQYADSYDVYVTLQTQLLPAANGTGSTVRTQLEASARDAAHGNAPVRCTSRRTLERRIVAGLQEKLGTGGI